MDKESEIDFLMTEAGKDTTTISKIVYTDGKTGMHNVDGKFIGCALKDGVWRDELGEEWLDDGIRIDYM